MSSRAREILQTVDKIAAEDTRHSKPLLQKLGIDTTLISYHDFSGEDSAKSIINELQLGSSIALISDAGTPLISDPGYKLVKQARNAGIAVLPIPGASAVMAALCVSGLPTDRFLFEGFVPAKSGARKKFLQGLQQEQRTCVVFESTHRIIDCLRDMVSTLANDRQIFIAREMSKKFETHFLGSADQCLTWIEADEHQQKGEFVIVIQGCAEADIEESRQELAMNIIDRLGDSLSMKDAVSLASEISGARKNLVYEKVLALTSPRS